MINPFTNIFSRFRKSSFTPENIAQIKECISPFRYGKIDLIKEPKDFFVKHCDNRIILGNFHSSPQSEYGVCEELAYKASRKLNEAFSGKFIFFEVGALNISFDMHHVSLMGIKEDTRTAKRLIGRGLEIEKKVEKLYEIPQGKRNQAIDEILSLYLRQKDVSDGVIVDPSFQLVKKFGDKDLHQNYGVLKPLLRKYSNPKSYRNIELYIADEKKDEVGVPLGFGSDLIPEFFKNAKDNIVFLMFNIRNKVATPYLGYTTKNIWGNQIVQPDRDILKTNPISNFLEFVNKSIKQ